MDPRRWNDAPDPELEQLAGGDLDMLELSTRLRAARPEPRIDPEFQRRLRVQLMAAAETQLRPRGLGRLLRPRSSLFAYGAAGLGGAMIAAAALAYYAPHSDHVTVVQGMASINEQHSVDPGNVIRISFNQEMDRSSVERGLKIQPAIAYYPPTWHGNELIITPRHSLQANSPYVVTIPRNAARDVKGDVATRDVVITFGTSPVAPVATGKPLGPVALTAREAGVLADGSLLGFSGDGSLLATSGLVAAPASAGGSPATPAPAPALVRYGGDGPVRLGDAVTAVALSPSGHSLATLAPSGDGVHGVVAVSDTDGTHRSVLSTMADARSPLGWVGDATAVLFVSGGQLTSVDLEHHQGTVAGVRLDPNQPVRLAPWGRYLFVGPPAATTSAPPQGAPSNPLDPSQLLPGIRVPGGVVAPAPPAAAGADAVPFATSDPGHVVDLKASAAAPLRLTGLAAGDLPGFSGDGRRVAWIDGSGAQPVISVQPLDGSGPAMRVLPALAGGDSVAAPSLDGTGERVAYAVRHGDGSGELRLVRVSDGSLLATAPVVQPSGLTFSPNGAALAYLQRSGSRISAELVSLAGVPGAPSAGTAVPEVAGKAIERLVNAEVSGDRQTLDGLVATTLEADLLG
ncbi:MAG TPA: Ig-like domain-containing protein, partial [Candidatus Dormibacteraeota bacterium]